MRNDPSMPSCGLTMTYVPPPVETPGLAAWPKSNISCHTLPPAQVTQHSMLASFGRPLINPCPAGYETQPLAGVGNPSTPGGGFPEGITIWLPVNVTGPLIVPSIAPTES